MKLHRRLIGGVLAAVGALFLLAGSTAPVWAYGPGAASISVTVNQSGGRTTLTVTGSGFGPDETVNFVAYPPTTSLGATTSDGAGAISTTLTLPAGFSAGSHTLSATGATTGNNGSAVFNLAQATQPLVPCAAAATSGSSGIVLAAFYSDPCAATSPPAAPNAAAAPRAPGSGLPLTGTDAELLAGVGAAALCAGGLMVLSSRRRRASTWK